VAQRRASARKKEVIFNNAVDIGVSTLPMSLSRRRRQMVPRLKDDNANQRPNIESLEVDKILRFVDCQNNPIDLSKCYDGKKKTRAY
jgi:hypothetical protein